jgi:transglutaminase-like putative cysteine protease
MSKTPPFLVSATLLFWGWQTGLPVPGAIMALVLESSRWIKGRWDFSDDDFSRVWTFCALLFFASLLYAFTSNDGPNDFIGLLQNPNFRSQRNAGAASAKTAAAVIRWLPMVFFPFIAAQTFSTREAIPLETISLIMRRRWKKARASGQTLASRTAYISYPYFAVCLFAAAIHKADDTLYFWGTCLLVGWALLALRPHRYRLSIFASSMALAILLGHLGQSGISRFQRYLETFNPEWLSSLMHHRSDTDKAQTAMGQIGRVKTSGQIIIRLQTKNGGTPPLYLRETCYRTFKVETWYAGKARSEFENILPQTNQTTWVLLPEKTNGTKLEIACYLDNYRTLLPLPRGSGMLENLPAYLLQKNLLGGVLAVGPSLVIFDAVHGPGKTLDADPDGNEDLYVSTNHLAAIDFTIAQLGLRPDASDDQKRQAVNAFFQKNFTYRVWQGKEAKATKTESSVARFLLRTHAGHCEYFATAATLLLRRLNIPARYAVGFSVHEAAGSKYVVRQRDAHAWCLAWNAAKQLWEDFDTTPASWVEAEGSRASPLQFVSDAWARIKFEVARVRWGQTNLRQYILWAVIPLLLILLIQIILRARRKKKAGGSKPGKTAALWPGVDSEFYELEKKIALRGVERMADEPLGAWFEREGRDPALAEVRTLAGRLLLLHYRYRFDPLGLTAPERELLRQETHNCLASL